MITSRHTVMRIDVEAEDEATLSVPSKRNMVIDLACRLALHCIDFLVRILVSVAGTCVTVVTL